MTTATKDRPARGRKRKDAGESETPPTVTGPDLSHILEPLRHLAVAIDTLNPDPANARKHDELNIQAIADSLRQFGQDQPLVVQKAGMIVRKGNGRLMAARKLGYTHMAAILVEEGDWKAVARALADNRTAELAQWDYPTLSLLLGNLKEAGEDVSTLGWTPDMLAGLLQQSDGHFTPDTAPETSTNPVSPDDMSDAAAREQERFEDPKKLKPVTCPHCATEFLVDPASLKG